MQKHLLVLIFAGLLVLPSSAQANVTEANFKLDTTADLVALCGVAAEYPNVDAAIHMCHGYVLGLIHMHILLGKPLNGRFFCVSDEQRPTRDEFVAKFVGWSRSHPEHSSKEAADGVLRWVADTYPCSE